MTGDIPAQDPHPAGTSDGGARNDDERLFSNPLPSSTSASSENIAHNGAHPEQVVSKQEQQQQQRQQEQQQQQQQAPPPAGPGQSNPNQVTDDNTDSAYHLKWIPWNSGMLPIVMQSINGPCPLIATMNVLLLREKIKLPNMLEQITESQLLAYIGESIMDSVPPPEAANDENIQLNLEQNINDAIEILPKLKTGLDVNIRFTGITDFEYTPECIIFDLLRIPLYHGWLSDPHLIELQNAIGQQSYNQLVDNIITNKASQDPVVGTRVLIAEEFLEKTASQLTLHGLNELRARIKDNEIGILFRNNHFLTLFKREGEIYTLVTDHGYLTEDNIVWETLDNIEGAGRFFDANFQLSEMTNRQVSEMKAIDERQQQMVNDFLVALSLKEEEKEGASGGGGGGGAQASQRELEVLLQDLDVARKLQAEEDRYYAEMIDKKEQRASKPAERRPRQDSVVPMQYGIDQYQAPAAAEGHSNISASQSASSSSTEPTASSAGSAPCPSYARVLEKRSIWETDRRSADEQADSWTQELNKVSQQGLAGQPAAGGAQTFQAVDPPTSQAGARAKPRQADSAGPLPSHATTARDDLPVPQATTATATPPPSASSPSSAQIAAAAPSQEQQVSSSSACGGGCGGNGGGGGGGAGNGRRSRSEKSSKESNCIVQ